MELKTKVRAEEGAQELWITREFDLPVDLLFKAYTEPELVSQWMGTEVLKLENRQHGSYAFETANPEGQVVFRAHGAIHNVVRDRQITRTFEMEGAPFGVQLELLEFEPLTAGTSRLTIHTIYKSAALRDQMLKLPFAQGINMAHNRLQEILSQVK